MRFAVSGEMVDQLRARWGRELDTVERERDAVVLDGGLGPVFYLTRDRRVLVDESEWSDSGIREASRTEATAALIIGARKSGVQAS